MNRCSRTVRVHNLRRPEDGDAWFFIALIAGFVGVLLPAPQ